MISCLRLFFGAAAAIVIATFAVMMTHLTVVAAYSDLCSGSHGAYSDRLCPTDTLQSSAYLSDPTGRYRFYYQSDGHTLVYDNAWSPSEVVCEVTPVDNSHTAGWFEYGDPGISGGNLNWAVHDSSGDITASAFTSGTDGYSNALILYANGRLRITDELGPAGPTMCTQQEPTAIHSGVALYAGDHVYSSGADSYMKYQSDGNLVLYRTSDNAALWSSGTANTTPGRAEMQTDGNFVIYNGSGTAIWTTGTSGNSGAYIGIEATVIFVMASDRTTALWNSCGC